MSTRQGPDHSSPPTRSERLRLVFFHTLGGGLLILAIAGTIPLVLAFITTVSDPHHVSFLMLGLLAVMGGAIVLVARTGWRALRTRPIAEAEDQNQSNTPPAAPSTSSEDQPERGRRD